MKTDTKEHIIILKYLNNAYEIPDENYKLYKNNKNGKQL